MKKVWRNKHIYLQTKLRLHVALILTTILYGAEVWPLTVTLSKKLEAAHHRWLRGILVITWRDKVMKKYGKEQDKYVLRRWSEKRRMRRLGRVTRMDAFRSKRCTAGKLRDSGEAWQTKDELERCGKEGPPKNGINLRRGWSISSRQTFVASTCGPMHRWCWMNQGHGSI